MGKMVLYYHGGSQNHGCEAIVRSTLKILEEPDSVLFSSAIEEDLFYGLNEIVRIKEDKNQVSKLGTLKKLFASVSHKLRRDDYHFYTLGHQSFFSQIKKNSVCLSVGGDNYCYKGQDVLGYYNKKLRSRGAKTVLWGCSVDPKMIDENVKRDLASYDLIVAREGISYRFLKSINSNTLLCCDPAFHLDKAETMLPYRFVKDETIGINASPLAAQYDSSNLFLRNYLHLIRYIIETTNYQIALIPHVVKPGDDDRIVLQTLYDSVDDKSRMVMVDDMNCEQLKQIISYCKAFIGARTHSTIAAYSTFVPTLVTGYSIKAKGIAEDIFGTSNNYVVPVQGLKKETDLTEAFCWILQHSDSIKNHLQSFIPEYLNSIISAKESINQLIKL